MQWWNQTWRAGTFVLGKEIGWSGAVVVQLDVLAAL